MIIKIIKSSSPSYWYATRINTIIPVVRVSFSKDEGMLYWCREAGYMNCLNFVKPCDCIQVEEDSEQEESLISTDNI